MELALIVQDLTVAYDSKPVLNDINLEIPKGKLVAIVGPNGAGKTTLLKTILSLIKPDKGRVTFPILKGVKKCEQIAYVPQNDTVDWDFPTTVLDVVMMGRYGHLGLFKRPNTHEKERALEMLKLVDMQDFSNRQIKNLSGGQQQRVFLARAINQDAKIYLMDEPFKGVDAKTQKTIISVLKQLKNTGKTVIVVHHDLHTVKEYFDWVTLVNSKVIAVGEIDEVFTTKNIQLTYGVGELLGIR